MINENRKYVEDIKKRGMSNLKAATFFVLLSLSCGMAYGADYYIDYEAGDDANIGTQASPWKHAPGDINASGNADILPQPGDTIYFKGGVKYKGKIDIRVDGASGNPITYKGDGWGSEKAIFDGSEEISGWQKCTQAVCGDHPHLDKIYYADIPWEQTPFKANLYLDDQMQWVAHDTNIPDPFYLDDLNHYNVIPKSSTEKRNYQDHVFDSEMFCPTGNEDNCNPHYYDGGWVGMWVTSNIVDWKPVTSYSPTSHILYHDNMKNPPYTHSSRDNYYCLFNILPLLDQEGEYVVNESGKRVFLWPTGDVDLESSGEVTISMRGSLLKADSSHVVVEGIIFQKGINNHLYIGYKEIVNSHILNNEFRYGKGTDSHQVIISTCDGCTVHNNRWNHNSGKLRGVLVNWKQSYNIIISNNVIDKQGSTLIVFYSCIGCKILNNTLLNSRGSHSNGMATYGLTHTRFVEDIVIDGNKVINVLRPHTLNSAKNFTVSNNIFYGGGSQSVSFWTGTYSDFRYVNNIMINTNNKKSFYQDNIVSNLVVKNNILEGKVNGDFVSNNIFTALADGQSEADIAGQGFLETDLDKLFLDHSSYDFLYPSDSPAIDSGVPTETEHDLLMNTRPFGLEYDIGAYEYQGCVEVTEADVLEKIGRWKTGEYGIRSIVRLIVRWREGCQT